MNISSIFGKTSQNGDSQFYADDDLNSSLAGFDSDQAITGLCDLYSPDKTEETHARDIADELLESNKISREIYNNIRKEQSFNSTIDIETLLIRNTEIEEKELFVAKANLSDIEFKEVSSDTVDPGAFEKLDSEFIKTNGIMPIAIEDNTLVIATSEPGNVFAIEDAKRQAQMDVKVVVCTPEAIEDVCYDFEQKQQQECRVDEIISDMTEVEIVQEEDDDAEDLEKMAGQSPVIKFVNYLISQAIKEGVSDIHIEPRKKSTKVRYRIDGVLFETTKAPAKMHPAIVSRIKIMSNLDISERRLPQDGKISVIVGGRGVDLRVSILPTNNGEKVVIRILDSKSIMRGLDELGMESQVTQAFSEQIALPHGIFLVTGPTGSGKSTTLYSALGQMDGETMNISTVEDPVEYELDFCNQVQTNEKIGMDFSSALRSLLRQDPDIIMIGEIRDQQTAKIAVQAALTGHLVLSTLHTNDAPSSITRLVNIGIEPYLIAASINGVLAQRLVRKICPNCKQPYDPPENMKKYLTKAGLESIQLFQGAGCDSCRGSGYSGRIGVYEMLIIDDNFRDMINKDSSVTHMRKAFQQTNMDSLFDDGIKKVQQGLTTIEEVLRVTEVHTAEENQA